MKIHLKKYYVLFLAFVLFMTIMPSHANAMTNEVSYIGVIKLQYDDAHYFSEGKAIVEKHTVQEFIVGEGKVPMIHYYT